MTLKNQIFPKEIIDNSLIVHQFVLSKKRKTIYTIILFSIISGFVSLPFIFIDVYSSATGIIMPRDERVVLQSVQSGRVLYSQIETHKRVKKGDTLLILENEQLEEKERLFLQKIKQREDWISDLKLLLNPTLQKSKNLKTQKYIAGHTLYKQQLFDLNVRLKKVKNDLDRNKALFEKQIIAPIEMEQAQFEFDLVTNNYSEFKKRIYSQWQNEYNQEQLLISELISQLEQLRKNKSSYLLIAPINGALVNVVGVQTNAHIIAGQPLAEISPESSLIVNCYVSPLDIGYLKKDALAKFQVDAYNYNQWGWATGKVNAIGDDIELIQNQAVFQVQCSLNENELLLKNGIAGELKKGMTVKAQFFRSRRSLWHLLFDKVDDWFNPMLNSNET